MDAFESSGEGSGPVRVAAVLADEVLFPDAAEVDLADAPPERHFAVLRDAGLFGIGARDVPFETRFDVAAALAGGCLATAFVWLQHQGAARAAAEAGDPAAADLASGRRRAGVAITALRPPAPLTARRTAAGWRLDGRVPWVTGWGLVDVLLAAALDTDRVRFLLLDAAPAATLRAEPLHLTAANASRTVTLGFDGHPVDDARLLRTTPLADVRAADAAGLAMNGALAIGVAARALRLAGPSGLDARLVAARRALLDADATALPTARAQASALAVRATTLLTTRTGARAVVPPNDAERLMREAQFLLVFGSRPSIRAALEPSTA